MSPGSAANDLPAAIGPYRILEILGEGGMGTVYLAEQRHPVQMRVALKLIKLGMDSKAVVARFEQERQALAMMQHDGIARVFQCGTSERGQPYFVMELVKGVPLNQYCDRNRLSLPRRLELMQQVCAAVQHAHQKGVVHRDLKPGNVLVGDDGGRPQVKIIDFGLAKATGKRLVEASMFTEAGQVVGTPEYMAPEQADPSNQDIDTRADVYSLGVMLYEVLVGQLPFSGHELRQAGQLEMQRVLREVEPPKPSTRLSSSADSSAATAAARHMSASALLKALKNDLDWVVLKALEKERNRRYESPGALAADLQRYLDHEPLSAGPPSATYRVRKLLRRYRGQAVAAAVVLLSLVAGGVATFVQYQRAEERAADALQQKNRAEEQQAVADRRAEENAMLAGQKEALAKAEHEAREQAQKSAVDAAQRAGELAQVLKFQEEQWDHLPPEVLGANLRRAVFAAADPQHRDGLEAALGSADFANLGVTVLDETIYAPSLEVIAKDFREQPSVKARLQQGVAAALMGLGLLDQAMAPQTEALEIRRRELGSSHPDTLTSMNYLAQLQQQLGRFEDAEKLYLEAIGNGRDPENSDAEIILLLEGNLGLLKLEQGHYEEAEKLCRSVWQRHVQLTGEDSHAALIAAQNLGLALYTLGRIQEAVEIARDILSRRRRSSSFDDLDTVKCLSTLAVYLQAAGQLDEGEQRAREALDLARKILGAEHPQTLIAANNLGQFLVGQGRFGEAEPLCVDTLQLYRRILGNDHPGTITAINNMGLFLSEQGRNAEAEPLFREALERNRKVRGEDHSDTLCVQSNLAGCLYSLSRKQEALALLQDCAERSRRVLGEEHVETLGCNLQLVRALVGVGSLAEAEQCARQTLAGLTRTQGREHPLTLAAMTALGAALRAKGDLEQACSVLQEACQLATDILGADNLNTVRMRAHLGTVYHRMGRNEEARTLLQDVLEKTRSIVGSDGPETVFALGDLCDVMEATSCFSEAEPLRREAYDISRRNEGDDSPGTLRAMFQLARTMLAAKHPKDALLLLLPAEGTARRVLGGERQKLASFLLAMGEAQAGCREAGDMPKAEAWLLEALALLGDAADSEAEEITDCMRSLDAMHRVWEEVEPGQGHEQKAREWQVKIEAREKAGKDSGGR